MDSFVILLDGDVSPTPRLLGQVAGTRTIAADGGIRHADSLGLNPELWMGDFDSEPSDAGKQFAHVERVTFPVEKDLTDGEIAVNAARDRSAKRLILAGAFGGRRSDHALLHKTMALQLAADGMSVLLSDGMQEGYPILPGAHRFDLPKGTLFSLVGFSNLAGLTISGVKWPLKQVSVPLGSSLTMSNVVVDRLEISLGTGKALLIAFPAA